MHSPKTQLFSFQAIPNSLGLKFGHSIGFENIYKRNHDLAKLCIAKARQLPVIEVVTPDDDTMFASLVSLRFKKDPAPMSALCHNRRIWITGGNPLRMSVHIHTRPEDLDAFFDGFLRAAETCRTSLIGGNMSAAPCWMLTAFQSPR